jgi:hypothetical protein
LELGLNIVNVIKASLANQARNKEIRATIPLPENPDGVFSGENIL